jgi:hypothetical protein
VLQKNSPPPKFTIAGKTSRTKQHSEILTASPKKNVYEIKIEKNEGKKSPRKMALKRSTTGKSRTRKNKRAKKSEVRKKILHKVLRMKRILMKLHFTMRMKLMTCKLLRDV